MKDLKEQLKECDEFKDTIMEDIESLLKKKKVKFTELSKYELVIKKKSKSDIEKIVNGAALSLKPSIFDILIKITESNKNTYIRQKYN